MTHPAGVDVLVVDDDEDDRALTVRALKGLQKPPSIHELGDGEMAIEYLCRSGRYSGLQGVPLPSLVLLDLKMPFRDGIEVLQAVRDHARLVDTPIVLLTSSEHERDITAAYKAGANAYIVKPGTFSEYLPCVRKAAEFWLEINRVGRPS